jgi:hypothetical protein
VRQIQSPVSRRDGGEKLVDLDAEWKRLEMNNRIPSLTVELVENNGLIVGWWDFDEYGFFGEEHYDSAPSAELLEEIARPIELSTVVTGDTPVTEVIERLSDSTVGWLFVVENGDVSGIVSYKDLFGPIGSLCLLALCFELEAAALRLCQAFSRQCFESLSEGRREKTLEEFKKHHNLDDLDYKKLREACSTIDDKPDTDTRMTRKYEALLERTMFIDKGKMINGCKLLIDKSASEVKRVFGRAERVRNACAHPPGPADVESVLELEQMAGFVRDCRRLTESILMVTPQPGATTDST